MKIKQVIDILKEKTGAIDVDQKQTNDQVIVGNPNQEVTAVVTTFMATIDVIHYAIAKKANLIITHEPTWYNGRDDTSWLKDDFIYQKKEHLLLEHNIVVWRFHDYMHSAKKDQIYQGFEQALGWHDYNLAGNSLSLNPLEQAATCYQIPKLEVRTLLAQLKEALNMKVIRYIGAEDAVVQRIGLLLGGSSLGLGDERNPMKLVQANHLDTVICGDITEWTLSAYIRDASMLGINKNMIILGHEKSEEIGMKNIVPWMKKHLPNLEISFIDSEEPFRYFTN
ncbi:Nif3-like dinuclear metal center hexameric protein [Amphibacillus jilinensis]|uniref:Nif3-like dinuclear metal center hexameric protein n=1 Tax=Amphibacillus jilinensis TaxID=1216008 RepID=UPI00031F4183|nr:Nif3-like dinuclear metal center hexameric protein [Amphibacillus jilinensis]